LAGTDECFVKILLIVSAFSPLDLVINETFVARLFRFLLIFSIKIDYRALFVRLVSCFMAEEFFTDLKSSFLANGVTSYASCVLMPFLSECSCCATFSCLEV